MTVLQLCNDILGSQVHANLYRHLAERQLRQLLFAPIRVSLSAEGFSLPFSEESGRVELARVVKPYHRLFYHLKCRAIYRALKERVDLASCDLIHAANLFSDGGVAYRAYKERSIPYIVAVRNTDVNFFLRLVPHTWLTGWRILLHARKIVFVSTSLMERFSRSWVIRPILSRIRDKFILQPNGVDDFWCDQVRHEQTVNHRILYAGELTELKNIPRLVEAVAALRGEAGFEDATLTLVGSTHRSTPRVKALLEVHKEWINYLGEIKNKSQLCDIYREHSIFAMPSRYETFGLVYVEALSQNLAILYTRGQGVDGLFSEAAGESVDSSSVEEIKEALARMLNNRSAYSNREIDFERFRWRNIAAYYHALYANELNTSSHL